MPHTTILIGQTLVVQEGETLTFTPASTLDTIAYGLQTPYDQGDRSLPYPTLINYGQMYAVDTSPNSAGMVLIYAGSTGFWENIVVENHGLWSVFNAYDEARGFWAPSWSPSLLNTGRIFAESGDSMAMGVGSYGFSANGSVFYILNEVGGEIAARGAQAFGVYAPFGSVYNNGLIHAEGGSIAGIGVRATGGYIENNGTIRSEASPGAAAWGIALGALSFNGARNATLINTGEIHATIAIDELHNSGVSTLLTNSGIIVGDINFYDGDDSITNSGSITGTVRLGDGDDIYDGRGGVLTGAISGGGGSDTLIGGDGRDTAAYSIASTSATWTRSPSGTWTVTAGADGADTLAGFEVLQFSDRSVYLDNAQQTFSGDGTSDILWRNELDGQVATWDVTGAALNSAAIAGAVGPEWIIQATGDFSGDGADDIALRNLADGTIVLWRNAVWTDALFLGAAPADWVIEAVGDFNTDGQDDFLWRNLDHGTVVTWLMDAAGVMSQHVISGAPSEWNVSAVTDFDGNGADDILWRNADGTLALWTTNGMVQTSAAIVGFVPTQWSVAGTGDFDGDGRADILWRNTSDGGAAIWLMNGAHQLAEGMIGAAPLEWSITDVGDYNGDGRDDILWRHSDGTLALWTMDDGRPDSRRPEHRRLGSDRMGHYLNLKIAPTACS